MLHHLLEHAPLGVYVVDGSFRISYANRIATDVFGAAGPELIGRDFDEMIHILWPQAYADELVDLFRHTLESGESYYAHERIEERRDRGEIEIYEWEIHQLALPGQGASVVCYFRDIGSYVRARTALQRQREELQTMLDVMPVGIAIAHDPLASRITMTRPFIELVGGNPGQNASFSAPGADKIPFHLVRDGAEIPPDQLPLQVAVRTGRELRDVEVDIRCADGRLLNMLATAAPLFDGNGAVRGAISAWVDVTSLKDVQRRLELAGRQKDEFLAMLAHELRNPLAPIRTTVDVLLRQLPEGNSRRAVEVIQRQILHMSRLVDDLLDVSRITRGQVTLRRRPTAIDDIVREAVRSVETVLQEKDQTVSIHAGLPGVFVDGDRDRLLQCFVNLLNNASKFTGRGGHVAVSTSLQGDRASVSITDTGIGLEPELLARIFDLFMQAEQGLDRSVGGLGIGLTIVQRLVELHGGTVSASSDGRDRGATFEVRLPVTSAPPKVEQPDAESVESAAQRILVVDDNVDAADALALGLELEGHSAAVAYSAEEALARVERAQFDVVILDIGLPRIDGYEVARRIRARPGGSAVRLLAVTGYGQARDRQRAASAGFDEHFVKPVDVETLRLGARPPVSATRQLTGAVTGTGT